MSAPVSARPAWLDALAAAPDRVRAVREFWDSGGETPVVGRTVERDGRAWCEVTFVWRQQSTDRSSVEVMVHVNGVTDAHRSDVTPALLERLPGTDLWHRSWWLPADGTWGYRFVEAPSIPRDAGATRDGWLAMHRAGRVDPGNPRRQPPAPGDGSSVLVLPGAYQHPAWSPTPDPVATPDRWDVPDVDGRLRTVRRWAPPGRSSGRRLLVLFDGEQWSALGLLDAVARAGLDVEVLLLDSHGQERRAADLPRPDRAATIVAAALARRAAETGQPIDAARVVVAGQSFGGLAAAAVALARPDLARTAVVQSGSFWYADGSEPRRDNPVPGDLVRALRAGTFGRPSARFVVQVGTHEGTMLEQARHFSDACRDAGARVSLDVVTGGHDYAWWKHHLLRALTDVTGG
ncbi:putative esterase [Beutenbergia cavernae DSM 12333]|uniref:Putative esterase n=1 Tax=Beutenbergia cavernae (strain ATCC BAA-8 / DSM 12333 / CCUG 43141 / JCM 11478 / NBRC 16432 / NCIMB 13614 / HKI 0122) TaxID=471853 RepID=C5BVG4_BEUC1|nr:enterochelin esterase domain-containing protein [Beutenbergia cavernae]ACQ78404.1 putative esterase [Beutenbergia cavernae DSM 12333]